MDLISGFIKQSSRRGIRRTLTVLSLLAFPGLALATEAAEESDGIGAGAPDTLATVATLGLGLLAVIAVIFISAWGIRRVQGMGGVNSQAMKVVAVLSVGQRERVALIDVGEKQILIGITPQSVRTLHVFDEPVVKPSAPGSGGDFASKLQQVLGRSGQPTGDKQ